MKIIAYYLPQFHCIPENDKWWGKGFTEWENVKAAQKYYEWQYQPRAPLNKNYYNLLDKDTMIWQSKLADEYGVYGFCFYHYWFGGKMLLEKPIEIYRKTKECKTHYCMCWANDSWTNSWVSNNDHVLIKQEYGNEEEWKSHFYYFLDFFKDDRYIKIDNKPLLILYNPIAIQNLVEMLDLWEDLSIENGFDGIIFASQNSTSLLLNYQGKEKMNYHIHYEPQLYKTLEKQKNHALLRKLKRYVDVFLQKYFSISVLSNIKFSNNEKPEIYDYDSVWKAILDFKPKNDKSIPGAFVDWDNTSRRKNRGFIIKGASPEKFYIYLKELILKSRVDYRKNIMFVFAWNEWAECGYLEPDEKFRYSYLEAVKKALVDTGELENND